MRRRGRGGHRQRKRAPALPSPAVLRCGCGGPCGRLLRILRSVWPVPTHFIFPPHAARSRRRPAAIRRALKVRPATRRAGGVPRGWLAPAEGRGGMRRRLPMLRREAPERQLWRRRRSAAREQEDESTAQKSWAPRHADKAAGSRPHGAASAVGVRGSGKDFPRLAPRPMRLVNKIRLLPQPVTLMPHGVLSPLVLRLRPLRRDAMADARGFVQWGASS
jgi:hypothetical protein